MGKTKAAHHNLNLVDFDDLIRKKSHYIAKELSISVQEMKKNSHPRYLQLIEEMLFKIHMNICKVDYSDKIVMVSCAYALRFPDLFNGLFIPSRNEFIKRNIQRGGTQEDSESWYDDIMSKWNGSNLLTIDDRFVSEIYK